MVTTSVDGIGKSVSMANTVRIMNKMKGAAKGFSYDSRIQKTDHKNAPPKNPQIVTAARIILKLYRLFKTMKENQYL
jgi:hypothetical protein